MERIRLILNYTKHTNGENKLYGENPFTSSKVNTLERNPQTLYGENPFDILNYTKHTMERTVYTLYDELMERIRFTWRESVCTRREHNYMTNLAKY